MHGAKPIPGALASMTGFARESGAHAATRFVWELKSVNGRSLDIRVRVPPGYDDVSDEARKRIAAAIRRGACQVSLQVTREERPPIVTVNEPLLEQLIELSARYAGRDGIAAPSLDGLLNVRGVVDIIEPRDDEATEAATRRAILAALDHLIAAFAMMRRVEGEALATILRARIAEMARLTQAADEAPGRKPEAVKTRLAEAVAAILDTSRNFDANRLHQEAVLVATRGDIREEIDRLRAHIAAAGGLIEEGGAVGRKLDFLAQEMAREANTLSAKANDAALNAMGLELKSVVEQFREQVQNVE